MRCKQQAERTIGRLSQCRESQNWADGAHIAYGDRCEGQKTHTDYADDTDLSFHGCFLTRLFHCMVMLMDSDASVIGTLKSWARNELAQNPLNHHIINGIDKTHKSIELIKKIREKDKSVLSVTSVCFFDCGTSIAAGDVCFIALSAQFWLSQHWESLPIVRSVCHLPCMNYELFGWCCRTGRSTSYHIFITDWFSNSFIRIENKACSHTKEVLSV